MPNYHAITPDTQHAYANMFAVTYTKEEFFISFANATPADSLQSDTIVKAVVKLLMHPTHAAAFALSLAGYVAAYKTNFPEPEPQPAPPEAGTLPADEKPPHIDHALPEAPTDETEPEPARPLIPSTLPDLNPPGIDKPPPIEKPPAKPPIFEKPPARPPLKPEPVKKTPGSARPNIKKRSR